MKRKVVQNENISVRERPRGLVTQHKIGNIVVHGTSQDFRKTPVEKLSVRYKEEKEKALRYSRKTKYKREVDPLRNRFDRMKSYCLKNKIDWRVDFRDYKRLWETAPEVWDADKGRMVPAMECCNRKIGVRATRLRQDDRFVAVNNLVLKHKGTIIHGPLSP